MAVWIFRGLPCWISNVSIYYAPELDIRVKSNDHFNFSRALVVHFERVDISWASSIHAGQKLWPFEFTKSFRCLIASVSIYYAPKSDIRVKSYDYLNFSRASVVHFWVSSCIMGLTHTSESKVMAVWICRDLPCSISSVSIYYAPELDIRVKSNDHLKFSRASVVHFQASRYIMGLTYTPEWNVMAVWIYKELPLFIFKRLDISWASSIHRLKSFGRLNLSGVSVFNF